MTEIWVVRHGETPWNVVRRVQGWEDIPLNEKGIAQAQALGKHLETLKATGDGVDAIYTSDLKRAHHTASILADSLGLTLNVEPGVRERHFGVLQGLIYGEMDQHAPEAAKVWRSRDPDAGLPGGESLGFFHRRVVQAIDDIAAKHLGQRVMVVSHGGAMDIIWRHATQVSLRVPREAPLLNASLNRLSVSKDGWKLINWGDVRHLEHGASNDITSS
jgi:probable phosphoglycerate mutase